MHRNRLLSLIFDYKLKYPKEARTLHRFITFIEKNENCFDRELLIGHITGSAWLIHPDRTKVLLTHHRQLNRWLQLGGHADGESDILSVATREAYEESGLEKIKPHSREIFDIDIHLIPERGREPAHHHYDVRFALQTIGADKFKVSRESHDLSWVPVLSLSEFTSEESILRMQKKWLS